MALFTILFPGPSIVPGTCGCPVNICRMNEYKSGDFQMHSFPQLYLLRANYERDISLGTGKTTITTLVLKKQ